MTAAVIYAFTVSGGPMESRNRQFDDQRTRNISSLKYEIENYYNKNYKLPETLNDLASDQYASKYIKDPETGENFEYIPYAKSGLIAYQLCANFSTDSQKINNNNGMYNLSYSGELTHPKGRHCFSFDILTYMNNNVYPTPTPYGQYENQLDSFIFDDQKISSVTSDATNIQYSNFPSGLFSSADEWGLINYNPNPVTVNVKFVKPVSLKDLSVTVSHCSEKSCYQLDAVGITDTGERKQITKALPSLATDPYTFKRTNTLKDLFSNVEIKLTRTGGDKYVHLKKIKFGYNVE